MIRILQAQQAMRGLFVIAIAAACTEPKYVPTPLPALVAPTPASEVQELRPTSLGFKTGDRMLWEVRLRGIAIGRVEITVGEGEIRSRFATGTLASAVANVEHDLVTVLDQHRPRTSHEQLELDGNRRQFSTDYTGTSSHSLHTALGAVRAWVARDAAPGFLNVVFGDKVVRLDLQRPSAVQGGLRVEGKIAGLDSPAWVTIYFDDRRYILRVEVRSDGEQITASPTL